MRISELILSKTDHKNIIDAVNQIISHIEEVKDEVRLQIKKLKKKITNIPKEIPFDFTEYVRKQKEDVDRDLGLLLELAEKKQDSIQSNNSKHSDRRYRKIENWLVHECFF